MKTRHLPETDLARIAPMQPAARRRALENLTAGFAPFSYRPLRKRLLDVMNAQPPLVRALDLPWSTLKRLIAADCRSDGELEANTDAGHLLYRFVREEGFEVVQEDFGLFPLGIGDYLSYWANAVLVRGDELILTCHDFRRGGGYTEAAKRFAFSVMHAQIRELRDDLRGARLALLQFEQKPSSARTITVSYADEATLFTYDDIIRMAVETYATWREVLEEQAHAARRTGTHDDDWWG